MMNKELNIHKNYSLKKLNQYGVDVESKFFVEVKSQEEVLELIDTDEFKNHHRLILGDGNNILFTKDFNGIVIRPQLFGKEIFKDDENNVWIKIYSAESWEDFVEWAVENNYQGIENMTMIPSSIGGAVSQNIAAYGQNIMDVVESLEALDLETGEFKTFTNEECEYRYRNSIFKTTHKNRFLIISAIFKLNKVAKELETSYHERKARYGSLQDELKSFATEPYTIQDVMQAVKNQRNKKLPSIDEYGTCGSVFANPIVSKEKYEELSKIIPELQSYPVEKLQYTRKEWDKIEEDSVKIPAGRIIDHLGWLGKWDNNVGVYSKHALCVVTNRKAKGEEVYKFVENIKADVKKEFDIDLEYEINII